MEHLIQRDRPLSTFPLKIHHLSHPYPIQFKQLVQIEADLVSKIEQLYPKMNHVDCICLQALIYLQQLQTDDLVVKICKRNLGHVCENVFEHSQIFRLDSDILATTNIGTNLAQMLFKLEEFKYTCPCCKQEGLTDLNLYEIVTVFSQGITFSFKNSLIQLTIPHMRVNQRFQISNFLSSIKHFICSTLHANSKQLFPKDLPLVCPSLRYDADECVKPVKYCLHELVEQQVAKSPEALALIFGNEGVTYSHLNRRANQLAHYLRSVGICNGTLVGICLEKCAQLFETLLAVLKAGGAYVPLDPNYPGNRLNYMLTDTKLRFLITHSFLLTKFPNFDGMSIILDNLQLVETIDSMPEDNLPNTSNLNDLAYIIYTSGSTGRPKGVMIELKGVSNLVESQAKQLNLTEQSRVLQYACINFDAALYEWGPTLISGGCLVPCDPIGGDELATLLTTMRISCACLTPSVLATLPNNVRFEHLTTLVVTGEMAVEQDLKRFAHRTSVYNGYGPTEVTVCATMASYNETGESHCIGKCIQNLIFYIGDKYSRLVPEGVAGELFLGGIGVARGYWNNKELTYRKFVSNPFPQRNNSRCETLFRTGDLVRLYPNGNLEFISRLDDALKLHGVFIELGEIETVILTQTEVQAAVVVSYTCKYGREKLVAFITLKTNVSRTNEEMSLIVENNLKRHLPIVMVPLIKIVDSLPLTPSGKVDRHYLSNLANSISDQLHIQDSEISTQYSSESSMERSLVSIWSRVLGDSKDVSVYTNFFQLGGDSIIAMELKSMAHKENIFLSVKQILEHPTIRELSLAITDQGVDPYPEKGEELEPAKLGMPYTIPLTPIQHCFFERRYANLNHWCQAFKFNLMVKTDLNQIKRFALALLKSYDILHAKFRLNHVHSWCLNVSGQVELINDRYFAVTHLDTYCSITVASLCKAVNISSGPLWGIVLIGRGENQSFIFYAHHLIFDAVSCRLIVQDFEHFYKTGGLNGNHSSYYSWSKCLQQYSISGNIRAELSFWESTLAIGSALCPKIKIKRNLDCLDSLKDSCDRNQLELKLSEIVTLKLLKDANNLYETSALNILLLAFSQTVSTLWNRNGAYFFLEGHGREEMIGGGNVLKTVGWFTSLFPVFFPYQRDEGISNNLKLVKEHMKTIPNNGIGYGVLHYLSPSNISGRLKSLPEPDICFNYLGQFGPANGNSVYTWEAEVGGEYTVARENREYYSINFVTKVIQNKLVVCLEYNTAKVSQMQAQNFLELFQTSLNSIISHCCDAYYIMSNNVPHSISERPLCKEIQPDIEDICPVFPLQLGLLLHYIRFPESDKYIVQKLYKVEGNIDTCKLQSAWRMVMNQFPGLRTGFVVDNWEQSKNRGMQFILSTSSLNLVWNIVKTNGLDLEVELESILVSDRLELFKLDKPPLFRITMVQSPLEMTSFILWTAHHIILDGLSSQIVLNCVMEFYQVLLTSAGTDPITQPDSSYKTYLTWLQTQNESDAVEFWKRYLQDFVAYSALPLRRRLPGVKGSSVNDPVCFEFDPSLSDGAKDAARFYKVSLNTLFHAVWALVLYWYNGEANDDIFFGFMVSGRQNLGAKVDTLVGAVANMVPFRIKINPTSSVHEFLILIQNTILTLENYAYLPISTIQRVTETNGKPLDTLFESLLTFEKYPIDSTGPLNISLYKSLENSELPLTISICDKPNINLKFWFDINTYYKEDVELMADSVVTIMKRVTAKCPGNTYISEVLSLTRNNLLGLYPYMFSNTLDQNSIESQGTIHDLFETTVLVAPDTSAIIYNTEVLSYTDLNTKCNQLSHYLTQVGVGAGVLVGLCMKRSIYLPLAALSIIKAGAAYVPIDSEYPLKRKLFIVQDAGIQTIVCCSFTAPEFSGVEPWWIKVINLDGNFPFDKYSRENPPQISNRCSLAYIIYSSGSTGTPKGVMIENQSVCNLALAQRSTFNIKRGTRVLQYASFSFDASVWEWCFALLNGGTLCLIPTQEFLAGLPLASMILKYEANWVVLPPSILQTLPPSTVFNTVEGIILAGESPKEHLCKSWSSKVKLYNAYGPTEATVCASNCEYNEANPVTTIGKPILGSEIYIMSRKLTPLPPLGVGEICISGIGLARGYLNRMELQEKHFVSNPLVIKDGNDNSRIHHSRLYRTGDVGRYLPSGNIEFLGREDKQVKLYGNRIELVEIERNILNNEMFSDAFVTVEGESENLLKLVAYVVPQASQSVGRDELVQNLDQYLRQTLPRFMIPSKLHICAPFPLTINGKVDHLKIKEGFKVTSQTDKFEGSGGTTTGQCSRMEMDLLTVWKQVLQVDGIGVDTNFFSIGGDSVSSIILVSKAKAEGLVFTVKQIFDNPTVQLLAKVCTRLGVTNDESDTREPVGNSGHNIICDSHSTYSLTPIQYWFFEQNFENLNHWNLALLFEPRKGNISLDLLNTICVKLLTLHKVFRTSFVLTESNPLIWEQRVDNLKPQEYYFPCKLFDMTGYGRRKFRKVSTRIITRLHKQLDICKGPLWGITVLDGPTNTKNIVLIAHHLIMDAVSLNIVYHDIQSMLSHPITSPIAPRNIISYERWSNVLKEYSNSQEVLETIGFWVENITEGTDLLSTPIPLIRYNGMAKIATVEEGVSRKLTLELIKSAPCFKTDVRTLVLTAFVKSLVLFSPQEQQGGCITLESHGREGSLLVFGGSGLEQDCYSTVGWFTSIYPLKFDLSPEGDLGDLITHVKTKLAQVPQNGIGFGVLRYLNECEDNPQLQVLKLKKMPQICFNYLGQVGSSGETMEILSRGSVSSQNKSSHKLVINIYIFDSELKLCINYDRRFVTKTKAKMLVQHFIHNLRRIVKLSDTSTNTYIPSDFKVLNQTDGPALTKMFHNIRGIENIYPLSPLQQGFAYYSSINPKSDIYMVQTLYRMDGQLNIKLFKRAWDIGQAKFETLRAGFGLEAFSIPIQYILASEKCKLPFKIVSKNLVDIHTDQILQRILDEDRHDLFDLTKPPLLRLALFSESSCSNYLLVTNHHIILDGWSCSILLNFVLKVYSNLCSVPIESKEVLIKSHGELKELSLNSHSSLELKKQQEAEQYWHQRIGDGIETTLLSKYNYSSSDMHTVDEVALELEQIEVESLVKSAKLCEVTLNTLLLATWTMLLSRYTNTNDVICGLTVSGRSNDVESELVGLLINTIPFYMSINGEHKILDVILATQRNLKLDENFSYIPLRKMCKSVFDTLFIFENYPDYVNKNNYSGLKLTLIKSVERTEYPMTICCIPGPAPSLEIRVVYMESKFDKVFVTQLCSHFKYLLNQLSTFINIGQIKNICVNQLNILLEEEVQKIVFDWNKTKFPIPNLMLHQLFEYQVELTPNKVAVVFEDFSLSYLELDKRANAMAQILLEVCLNKSNLVVGLCLNKSIEMLVAVLAIIKSGSILVPIDPANPVPRMEYIVKNSEPGIIVTEKDLGYKFENYCGKLLHIENIEAQILSSENRKVPVSIKNCGNICYIMYTSGSTGVPKGVCIKHRSIVNRVVWAKHHLGVTSEDTILHKAPLTFDISILEIFLPLITGSKLVISSPGVELDSEKLVKLIFKESVTILHFIPTLLSLFLQNGDVNISMCKSLRVVLTGGEVLASEMTKQFFIKLGWVDLVNEYGPTEATIDVTFWHCNRGDRGNPPIGRPKWNVQIYILDSNLNPVPVGVVGEIFIGGDALAHGYLKQEELTRKQFLCNKFTKEGLMYRTGDLGRFDSDGIIHFIGRLNDDQIKINGVRIETQETVEILKNQHNLIHDGVVVYKQMGVKGILVAYMIPIKWPAPAEGLQLLEQIYKTLQDHLVLGMRPQRIILMERFPLQLSGKLDKNILPFTPSPNLSLDKPQSNTEKEIGSIWSQVLRLGDTSVCIDDNFFRIGGDSISAILVASRLQRIGYSISVRDIFKYFTVRSLALRIDQIKIPLIESSELRRNLDTIQFDLLPIQEQFYDYGIKHQSYFNQAVALKAKRHIDRRRLTSCLSCLAEHQEALHSLFEQINGKWVRVCRFGGTTYTFTEIELGSDASVEDFYTNLQSELDIVKGPIWRCALVTIGNKQVVFLCAHHLIVDGISWQIIIDDLSHLYTNYNKLTKSPPLLRPVVTTYSNWMIRLREFMNSRGFKRHEEYWTKTFSKWAQIQAPIISNDLEIDKESSGFAEITQTIGKARTKMFMQVNHKPDQILLLVLAKLVSGWTKGKHFYIMLEKHGREDSSLDETDLSRTVGWFTTMYPVMLDVGDLLHNEVVVNWDKCLRNLKRTLAEIPDNGLGYGLLKYVSKIANLEMPEIHYNYLGGVFNSGDSGSSVPRVFDPDFEHVGKCIAAENKLPCKISLNCYISEQQLKLKWTYDTQCFRKATIQNLIKQFEETLIEIVDTLEMSEITDMYPHLERNTVGYLYVRKKVVKQIQPNVAQLEWEINGCVDKKIFLSSWKHTIQLKYLGINNTFVFTDKLGKEIKYIVENQIHNLPSFEDTFDPKEDLSSVFPHLGFGYCKIIKKSQDKSFFILTVRRSIVNESEGEDMMQSVINEYNNYSQISRCNSSNYSTPNPILPIHVHGNKPPLILIHSGLGTSLPYLALPIIDTDQPIYGINNPHLGSESLGFRSLEEMASFYNSIIQPIVQSNPIRLGGWSFGGIVALEMARQFREIGKTIDCVIMIDSIKDSCRDVGNKYECGGLGNNGNVAKELVQNHKMLVQNYTYRSELPIPVSFIASESTSFVEWVDCIPNLKCYSVKGLHLELFDSSYVVDVEETIRRILNEL